MKRTVPRIAARNLAHVLLVSDTHGILDPRIAALAATSDVVVHAGDIGNRAVLDALRPLRGRVCAVRGNNDAPGQWPAAERAALRQLTDEMVIVLPGGLLIVTHGDAVQPAGRRVERLRECYPHARAVVFGHTHRILDDRSARPWVLNPGAAGRVRTFGGPSCMLLTASERRWHVHVQRFSAPEPNPPRPVGGPRG